MRIFKKGTMKKANLLLVLMLTVSFIVVIPAFGLTQSSDQLPVIDDAGIFKTSIGAVEAAASTLTSQGADIRVRTIATYGAAGNLDQYEAQLERQSPSWIDQDGNRKNPGPRGRKGGGVTGRIHPGLHPASGGAGLDNGAGAGALRRYPR